jgi:hypothetical protein
MEFYHRWRRRMTDTADTIRSTALFEGVSQETLLLVSTGARIRTYGPQEVILNEAEPAGGLWVVLDGRVKLSKPSSEGRSRPSPFSETAIPSACARPSPRTTSPPRLSRSGRPRSWHTFKHTPGGGAEGALFFQRDQGPVCEVKADHGTRRGRIAQGDPAEGGVFLPARDLGERLISRVLGRTGHGPPELAKIIGATPEASPGRSRRCRTRGS